MKGVVFNLLEEAVTRSFGPEVWDDLVDEADVSGAYTSLGNYSDDEIVQLVAVAATKLSLSPSEVLRWFGEKAMPILKERYGALFVGHPSAKNFVLSVNSIIHPEVRKLYAGAACPYFHFKTGEEGATLMSYQSSRKMCDLAHGFIKGASKLFCEEVDIHHLSCMNHGADRCLMEVKWHQ
ncbi:heme NO-binding domain-containing protein [Lichenibacterium ramalinae]|uniref:Heme NO-binding protein n=1 Tax=Lichenibacterium ramalinae TaxID=2316527 RepID=A0A4Q2R5E7_9HYPH|nr:heme NO-binding domain-containing protein [Lichenibacterium ramalinae]RYB01765.1 heme NO-binding protein [Lichenibacterium ramalinae]